MNNKGFAVSAFMYMLLILGIILILATLSILSSRKMILDKQKSVAMDNSLQSRKKICKAINGVKLLIPGTKYECQVNNTNKFNFYVLSVEGSKVNLIMDRNICENGQAATAENTCLIEWYASSSDNSSGPVTALEGLHNATKSWNNVKDIKLKYDDIQDNTSTGYTGDTTYGYKGISITNGIGTITNKTENSTTTIGTSNEPLKARLPKISEVYSEDNNDTTHCHSNENTCPAWLTNGLAQYSTYYPNNDYILGINGYWTLSSNPGNSNNANYVYNRGNVTDGNISYNNINGLRPVITVLKSNLYN